MFFFVRCSLWALKLSSAWSFCNWPFKVLYNWQLITPNAAKRQLKMRNVFLICLHLSFSDQSQSKHIILHHCYDFWFSPKWIVPISNLLISDSHPSHGISPKDRSPRSGLANLTSEPCTKIQFLRYVTSKSLQDFKSIRTSASARNILDTVSVAASESRILIPVTNNYFKLLRSRTFVRLARVKAVSIDAATNPSSVVLQLGLKALDGSAINTLRFPQQEKKSNLFSGTCPQCAITFPALFPGPSRNQPQRNLEPSLGTLPQTLPDTHPVNLPGTSSELGSDPHSILLLVQKPSKSQGSLNRRRANRFRWKFCSFLGQRKNGMLEDVNIP